MVKVGDKIPSGSFKHIDASGIQEITVEDLTSGKKVTTSTAQKHTKSSAVVAFVSYDQLWCIRRSSFSLCLALSHQRAGELNLSIC